MRTRSASSLTALTDSSFPGNPVLKILNLNLTYDASRVSPQSRNGITGSENTPLFSGVSSNMSLPSHSKVKEKKKKKTTVNPVTHCPQVIHSDISWQTVTTDKSFAWRFYCALTLSTALMGFVKKCGPQVNLKNITRGNLRVMGGGCIIIRCGAQFRHKESHYYPRISFLL